MCGISAIINKGNQRVSQDEIQFMNDLISHRGPDGEGFYFGDNFAFGHRRLAILDLSPDGHQPMHFKEELVITYNGEIFNYIEIRAELQAVGYTFKSQSDTEVILAAYHHWGKDCVQRFNGMWSFIIHDKRSNQLFCSRDRFGIKPFYYLTTADRIYVGSEIKQLLPFVFKRKANHHLLLDYLIAGVEEFSNATFFEGIIKLEQGHNLIYDLTTAQHTIERYYHFSVDRSLSQLSEDEAVQRYKAQLENAVQLRMRSDVEVGTCLSGGLDSSSITALAAKNNSNDGFQLKTIHAKATEKQIDESHFAEMVANHTGSEMHILEPSYETFREVVDKVIETQEEPFGSPSIVLQYLVLEKARQLNCIVMLDGQGGDETLLGYQRYYPAFLLELKGLKKIKGFIRSSENSDIGKLELLKFYLYFTNYKLRLRYLKRRNKFYKKEVIQGYKSAILKEITSNYTDLVALQKLEVTRTQLPHLLKYEDKNSMAHSVETRLPFLDYRCVELAVSLPNQYKIKDGWTKNILRKAVDQLLPKEIVWRKNKFGFAAPEQVWLKAHENEICQAIESSKMLNQILDKKEFNYNQLDLRTKWRLYNVAKWEKQFNVEW